MAKKRVTSGISEILGYTEPTPTDNAIMAQVQAGGDVGLISLFPILPDPDQPRDLLPEALYERLFAGEPATSIMQTWLTMSKAEGTSPAQKQAVAAVEQLAATIEQHDLIQPIAVCETQAVSTSTPMPEGVDYIVIAGERRWWAHVWLFLKKKGIKNRSADKIKAITLPADSNIRALQLIENTMRENLTAIERANGLIALRQEMSKGKSKLVPWTAVERELGLSRTHRWRIEQVLNLSEEAQQIVRWYGLSEGAIRPITINKEMQKRPDLQVVALQKLAAWQEANEDMGNARLAQYIKQLLNPQKTKKTDTSPDPVKLGQLFQKRVSRALKLFSGLDNGKILQIAESMREDAEAQEKLIALEKRIAQMRKHWER